MHIAQQFMVIVPAAGVGKRMQAGCPKQYLRINKQTILSHTVNTLLNHPNIAKVIIAISEGDEYFGDLDIATNENIIRVSGGAERVDSVLSGLKAVDAKEYPWVLVHDAARPCVTHNDIDALILQCLHHNVGGILASPVRDTMKRGIQSEHKTVESLTSTECKHKVNSIKHTVEREQLWHALTPQLYKTVELTAAIEQALFDNILITDEASAIESANLPSLLVMGSDENIKITRPDDLALAEFYLNKQASVDKQ